MEELLQYLKQFSDERDWQQFHTPNNLAKSIVLEANELLEHYQFNQDGDDHDKILEELADTLTYCFDLCIALNVDPIEIVYHKMSKNAEKYPVEKCKGSSLKYTAYQVK